MAVSDWSTTAGDNGTVGAINIAELCPSANLNNAIREVMAQIAQWRDGLGNDYQAKDGTLTALAGQTLAADKLLYATGPDAFALATLTSFARTLLDDADAAAACLTLGAVRVAALSLASPGYIKFQVGASSFFQVAWGSFTANPNVSTGVSYAAAFPNASFPVISGAVANADANSNDPGVTASTASGFTAFSAANVSVTCFYIAVGY